MNPPFGRRSSPMNVRQRRSKSGLGEPFSYSHRSLSVSAPREKRCNLAVSPQVSRIHCQHELIRGSDWRCITLGVGR